MSALFLTDEELQELTDCPRKREQIEWLKDRRTLRVNRHVRRSAKLTP